MPKFTVTKGPLEGQNFSFGGEVIFIGRSADNDIQLKIGQVSRKHFKIYRVEKKTYVEDLNSKNGTYVNGEMFVPGKGAEVKEHDVISIANTELKLTGLPGVKPMPEEQEPPLDKGVDSPPSKAHIDDRRVGERNNMDLIWGVTELLRKDMDIDDVLQKVLGYILDSLPRIDTAVIVLFDEKRKEVWDTVSKSRQEKNAKKIRYSIDILEKVMKERKSIRMSDMNYEAPEDITDSINELGISVIIPPD